MGRRLEYVPLSTNALMRHLRARGVSIKGSSAKRKLQNVGYYHGYKGYRFARERRNPLPLTDFDQVLNLYAFDMELKTLFYPRIMQVETSLKSCILDVICAYLAKRGRRATFEVVCSECLTGAGAKDQYRELSYLAQKVARQSAVKNIESIFTHAFCLFQGNQALYRPVEKGSHLGAHGNFDLGRVQHHLLLSY